MCSSNLYEKSFLKEGNKLMPNVFVTHDVFSFLKHIMKSFSRLHENDFQRKNIYNIQGIRKEWNPMISFYYSN